MTPSQEKRLRAKIAALAKAEARVEQLRAEVAAGCRAYSDALGFRMRLLPAQVLTDMDRLAKADTHPQGGDRRAPFMSGAVTRSGIRPTFGVGIAA